MSMETKSRFYCYTIPNYSDEDLERFHALAASLEKHVYICYGLEIAPTTGTKHIQGYIQLRSAQRFKFLQKYFAFKDGKKILKFHIEPAKGTLEENKAYARKEGQFFEFGEPVSQGARTDMKKLKEAVEANPKAVPEIIHELVTNVQQLKFVEGFQRYCFKDRDPSNPPKVFWIFGPPEIGKTRLVHRTFKNDICFVSNCEWLGTNYRQQECFFLDDFREFKLPFADILRLTDRYPYQVFYKGGQIAFNSPFIIFTSPRSVDNTFVNTKEDLFQLKRRLIEINLEVIENKDEIDLRNLDEKFIYVGY